MSRPLGFLTDYGPGTEHVGALHAVAATIAPGSDRVDLAHDVPPGDVRWGSILVERLVRLMPRQSVTTCVVDPGVGTGRRAVALELEWGKVVVGPDNGLLAPAVAMVGGATRAVSLTDTSHHLDAPGPLFDGRDVFAPVAARLCAGVPLEDLGEPVDPAGLMPGLMPGAREEPDGTIVAEVLWVDRFGNVQLNLGPDDLPPGTESVELRLGGSRYTARRVRAFSEVTPGGLGLAVDSYGMLAVVADRSSAAEELRAAAGDEVVVSVLGDVGDPAVTTAVQIGRAPAPASAGDPTSRGENF